ncbi:MAG: CinA family protein [Alphaproteobacteria bacterium]|nr:CinA family protein [Alphaproteobacteria bacterium]
MDSLKPVAHRIAAILKERKQTLSIAEGSAGGLMSAAMLAVPGASAYFMGGAVVYTRVARRVLLNLSDDDMRAVRPSTANYSRLMADACRSRFATDWAIAESGATGPTGNRYGDAAGHAAIAVSGPVALDLVLETGHGDREGNMRAFAQAALELLERALIG